MQTSQPAPNPYNDAMNEVFGRLPVHVQDVLLLGVIPHVLDAELAKLLFPEETEADVKIVRSFGFTSEPRAGQIEYHNLARRYLLDLWMIRDPDQFRRMSGVLAREYRRRLETSPADSTLHASEWLFHNLAVDPAGGMSLVSNLFDELLESRELGSAERLLRLAEEQRAWIGSQSVWLDYFGYSLAYNYYKELDPTAIEKIAAEQGSSLLAANCLRLLGRNAVRKQRWADGRDFLLKALKICNTLDNAYIRASVHTDLGDLFQNLVESSGGILVETRELDTPLRVLYYALSRGPLWIYRLLAERVNWLPNLYSMNYQNWVALHFLRLALRNYRSAEKQFKQLQNRRGQIEIANRMAGLLFTLSHSGSAERLCRDSLKEGMVKNSPYYTARFESILGQAAMQHKNLEMARDKLSNSLEIFERYGDWENAARVAQNLGEACEKEGKAELALDAYRKCLESCRKSRNSLQQTEMAYRLEKLARKPALSESLRQRIMDARRTIRSLVFMDRYPGPVQESFHRLTRYLTLPSILLILLFTVAIAFGSFLSVSFITGEPQVPYLDPVVWWSQALFLFAWILLPLLALWGYNMTYALLGHLVILGLGFTKVDEAQPNLFVLDDQAISQQDWAGGSEKKIVWENIRTAVIDNRVLFSRPMTFSSSILLRDKETSLLLPASTFRYSELEKEVTYRLKDRQSPAQITSNHLRILEWSSLLSSLLMGVILAGIIVISQNLFSCYGAEVPQGADCPEANRLYYLPILPLGMFFTSLIFGIVSLARWLSANWRMKKASKI
jgi:tetratricopeptide (TPR) repeat protein